MDIQSQQHTPTSFTSVNILKGGEKFLKQEGSHALDIARLAQDEFKHSKWSLNICENGYEFISPTTKKTYGAPFKIKRHTRKTMIRPEPQHQILLNMSKNGKTINFAINCENLNEVRQIYKLIKDETGIKKMIMILRTLEGKILSKHREAKIEKMNSKIEALKAAGILF